MSNIPDYIQDNTCNYSKDWQPYMSDYDKFEYDIKTKDGRTIFNCYPNARKFSSFKTRDVIHESEVAEIRFSENPIVGINYDEFYKQ